ncbi:MAG: SH3 domain-containing protein, partial [Eubacteriales bacterium]|nr:SH3 domain-containing protein [Eubacteriales bacterium]
VLTWHERNLAYVDNYRPPFSGEGYVNDETGNIADEIMQRLFNVLVKNDYKYIDGVKNQFEIQFLAERKDTQIVLLCLNYDKNNGWVFTESSPLPKGTYLGVENLTQSLYIPGRGDCSIRRYASGKWGAWYADFANISYGENYLLKEFSYSGNYFIGSHPFSDITLINWENFPTSFEEAKKSLNQSNWATPNNKNPEDRLHLREKPDRKSRSLGKFYNGAPIYVLQKGKQWTHVRIGKEEGYMMTKFLAFNKDMNAVEFNINTKIAINPVTEVYWQGEKNKTLLSEYEVDLIKIIGVIGNEWYIVWDMDSGLIGKIRQEQLQDGNG